MSWLEHYEMEKRRLDELLSVVTSRYLNGDTFENCDKINLDTFRITLNNIIRNYSMVFSWVREEGSDNLKERLHNSLLDYYPTYKNDEKLDLNFEKVIKDGFSGNFNESIVKEYYNSLINRKFTLDELHYSHKELIEFQSNLISFKKTLDHVCELAFGSTLDGGILSVESLEYAKEYKDFYLIINALPHLKYKRIPNKSSITHCSLFGNKLPNLFRNRKVGFVYDYQFSRIISMETEDSYCVLEPDELNSTKDYLEAIIESLLSVERINLENKITYTISGLCRILPLEYLIRNTNINSNDINRKYNEIVIDGDYWPSAIFVVKGALSEERVKAFNFVYDLPVIIYDKERNSIRKVDYRY